MDRPGCSECTGIAVEQLIRSPGELHRILQVLKSEIARGALEQKSLLASPGLDQPSVEALLSEPYPDVFCSGFRCRYCGQNFQLACETYHGSGGRWSVVMSGGA